MLANEQELRHAYEVMAKMYGLRDRCAQEPVWSQDLREEVVAGIEAQMRQVEREIAEYLAQQYSHAKAA